MQKIHVKLQSVFCLSSSALYKSLRPLGEDSPGHTMEGEKTWAEISSDHHHECPKQAANFIRDRTGGFLQ